MMNHCRECETCAHCHTTEKCIFDDVEILKAEGFPWEVAVFLFVLMGLITYFIVA
jgi:hypothetical protein